MATNEHEQLEKHFYKPEPSKWHGMQANHFILTFPNLDKKWDKDSGKKAKAHMEKKLFELYGKPGQTGSKLEKYMISWEHHKTINQEAGSPHAHVVFSLIKNPSAARGTWKVSNRKLLQSISPDNKPGNYQTARMWQACVIYLTKEDKQPTTNFSKTEIEAMKLSKTNKKGYGQNQLAIDIQQGKIKDLEEVYHKHPALLMQYHKNIVPFFRYHEEFNPVDGLLPWNGLMDIGLGKPEVLYTIRNWFNQQIQKPRKLKAPNLMIYAETNAGKTHLWSEVLSKSLKVYPWNQNENYQCNYNDGYDLIVYEEFCGKPEMSKMNEVMDGQKTQLPKKTVGAYWKKKNVPVLILTNIKVDDLYTEFQTPSRQRLWNAWRERFTYVEIPQGVQMDYKLVEFAAPPPPPEDDEVEILERTDTEILDLDDSDEVIPPTQPKKHKKGKPLEEILVYGSEEEEDEGMDCGTSPELKSASLGNDSDDSADQEDDSGDSKDDISEEEEKLRKLLREKDSEIRRLLTQRTNIKPDPPITLKKKQSKGNKAKKRKIPDFDDFSDDKL